MGIDATVEKLRDSALQRPVELRSLESVPRREAPTQRSQWTIKSRKLTAELRMDVRAAARKVGMAQGDYVVARLRDSARADLMGSTPDSLATDEAPGSGNPRDLRAIEGLAQAVDQLHAKIDRLERSRTPAQQIVDGVMGLIWGTGSQSR